MYHSTAARRKGGAIFKKLHAALHQPTNHSASGRMTVEQRKGQELILYNK
jgi:hypothetical protein